METINGCNRGYGLQEEGEGTKTNERYERSLKIEFGVKNPSEKMKTTERIGTFREDFTYRLTEKYKRNIQK